MVESANRERVVAALEERLRGDPARTQVSRVSEFGLVEVTRKRSRTNLRQALTRPCPCCGERGRVKSPATVCLELRREALARGGGSRPLVVRVHPEVAAALTGEWAEVLRELEERLGAAPRVEPDATLHLERFELVEGGGEARGAR